MHLRSQFMFLISFPIIHILQVVSTVLLLYIVEIAINSSIFFISAQSIDILKIMNELIAQKKWNINSKI